jgi:formyl-CoA transferase
VELDRIISAWTKTLTVDEVDERMQEAGVPAGRIFRAPDMLDDPHYKARDAIVDTPTADWPNLKMQNIFPKMSKTQGEIRWTGPETLGQHNDEVYGDLIGLSAADIRELKEKSII